MKIEVSHQNLKDALLEKVWNMSNKYYMDVFFMTMCSAYGLSLLGTRKLKKFMSIVGSLFESRKNDSDFYTGTSHVTIRNDFLYTDMAHEIELICEGALDLANYTQTHVFIVVANEQGRKFIFATDKVKPYVTTSAMFQYITQWETASVIDSDSDSEIETETETSK